MKTWKCEEKKRVCRFFYSPDIERVKTLNVSFSYFSYTREVFL